MYFTVEKIEGQLKEIFNAISRGEQKVGPFRYLEDNFDALIGERSRGLECPEFDDRGWDVFEAGAYWGGYDRLAWFRAWVSIPPEWQDGRKLALRFQAGPRDGGGSTAEAMLYVNGAPLQAIDIWHEHAWLPPEVVNGGRFLVAIKAWSGVLEVPERRRFKVAQLLWIDEVCERFYHRALALIRSVKQLDANDLRRVKVLEALNGAFHRIDFLNYHLDAFYTSLAEAEEFLNAQAEALASVQEIKPRVVGIGHAHIDVGWLWRVRHSREKAARTFTTALHLMRQYPAYHFMHSTPQIYKFLKQDYPDLYARVKERIAAGQWEITGGMWVEADTNLTSGESLVRQFLLGKRFVRQEFGVEMKTLWLPDVFGYSGALPQIIKKCGVEYFLTTKISWNQYNRFPNDTFHWRGIDGSEVLTHFVTTPDQDSHFYTYNARIEPYEVKGIWDNYRQKDANDELLMLYGWGDGGGGPTQGMIESALALKNLPGMPSVELGNADPFMDRLAQRTADTNLPVWDGELYLEYHRGTYTSQAHMKRANRKAEVLYHNAEWLSALAGVLTGLDYPAADLREGWELILTDQFHDILPGSSIRQVYEDARRDYTVIDRIGQAAVQAALQSLQLRLACQEALAVFNPLSWKRSGLVELPWSEELERKAVLNLDGRPALVQVVEEQGGRKLLVQIDDCAPLGYEVYPAMATVQMKEVVGGKAVAGEGGNGGWRTSPSTLHTRNRVSPQQQRNLFRYPILHFPASGGGPVDDELIITPTRLENVYYRILLNAQGQITSLWDKEYGREVLAPEGRANVLQAFEDKPVNFDAWDIDLFYQEKQREIGELIEIVVEETGPARGALRLCWRFGSSTITQRVTLYRRSRRIDFRTKVDWQERQVLLKAAFPVDVRATRATYDIQFGNLERPTHWNTSWDWARFEVVGHKWADLSEGDYGVALLNDCKYGYDIKDNVMRLTLIKSAISPDETADRGLHEFTYSLLPHTGSWREGHVIEAAYDLNNPLLGTWLENGPTAIDENASIPANLPMRFSFAELDTDAVIVETVKRSEDDPDAWVIRLYETKQTHRRAVSLRLGRPIHRAVECNLVEEGEAPVNVSGNCLTFPIGPFEIKTFKVWF